MKDVEFHTVQEGEEVLDVQPLHAAVVQFGQRLGPYAERTLFGHTVRPITGDRADIYQISAISEIYMYKRA
ncbi:hypothetical protein GWI33_012041 [Rhynchophorus ferrugineus]|uniref:Uncharacterized protein n=1 Tax=Rhynchophorus ferrugineus TaxID=354439 RepID=A0A834MB64_RHYFE|nr:hypothetical protein GWI33_012041 [Rhynchophorus ferrugineus]